MTVKLLELASVPPGVVTLMVPVVAPAGTVVVIVVAELSADGGGGAVELDAGGAAEVGAGDRDRRSYRAACGCEAGQVGGGMTVKLLELASVPLGVVTLMVPVVAPAGTVVVIVVAELVPMAAVVPLNVTLVAPPRLVPVIVTDRSDRAARGCRAGQGRPRRAVVP